MSMYSTLSIGIETIYVIVGILINIGVLWTAVASLKRSISKDNKKLLDSKADLKYVEKMECDIDTKIEHLEKDNIRWHGEIRADITMSETRTKDDYRRGFDQIMEFMKEIKEDIRAINKNSSK